VNSSKSCWKDQARWRSSMSVILPYHLRIRPCSSRNGTAATENQRNPRRRGGTVPHPQRAGLLPSTCEKPLYAVRDRQGELRPASPNRSRRDPYALSNACTDTFEPSGSAIHTNARMVSITSRSSFSLRRKACPACLRHVMSVTVPMNSTTSPEASKTACPIYGGA
jgi:hypothetical protein